MNAILGALEVIRARRAWIAGVKAGLDLELGELEIAERALVRLQEPAGEQVPA